MDLSKVGSDIKSTIIIDNSPISYQLHRENSIPIKTWYDDPFDNELMKLVSFLIKISHVNDVRCVL